MFCGLLASMSRRVGDWLEIERPFAFNKEDAVRSRVATRGVAVPATRLQKVRAWPQSKRGLALRGLNISAGDDQDPHVVGVRVQWSGKSGRQLEQRPEGTLAMAAPEIGDFDSRSGGSEISPLNVTRGHHKEALTAGLEEGLCSGSRVC